MKSCTKCLQIKREDEFYLVSKQGTKLTTSCKECQRAARLAASRRGAPVRRRHGTSEYWEWIDSRKEMIRRRNSLGADASPARHKARGPKVVDALAFVGDMVATGTHSTSLDSVRRGRPYVQMMALCEEFEERVAHLKRSNKPQLVLKSA